MKILTRKSTKAEIERHAGNKAQSLHRLGALGVAVPPWAAIGAGAFTAFVAETGLKEAIERELKSLDRNQPEMTSSSIAALLDGAAPTDALRALVSSALDYVGGGQVAVRSSGIEEDSADYSFAGQFDSFLDVVGIESTITHVKRCWASAYSARSLAYRKLHGLDLARVEMAVIIQRLVPADKSGVVFTANPTSGDADEAVLSAVYGLGEGLVSGAVDADTLTLDKKTGAIRTTVVGEKAQRHDGMNLVDVDPSKRTSLCLSPIEIDRILVSARTVERGLLRPQDIEWCIEGDTLWILQARPITTPLFRPDGELRIWDNSNILENYPGVSSQLTYTFARHVYARVFRDFNAQLGVPEHHLRVMDDFLPNILGYVNGRIYYNLLHWYKLSGLTPFADLGQQMMEIQMGVAEPLDRASFEGMIRAFVPRSALEGKAIRARTAAKFAYYFLSLERSVDVFRGRFYGLYSRYEGLDFETLTGDEVYAHYRAFERELLEAWGRMIALESSIGLSYGLLRILTKRWLPTAPEWFQVAVIGGIDGMESVEPARRLETLAATFRRDPGLVALVREHSSSELLELLEARGQSEALSQVNAYIDEFGYRANNELKLEEPDLRESPAVLFDMLRSSLGAPAKSVAPPGDEVEQIVRTLDPLKRVAFNRVRARVRAAIGARETVRLCRSRTFGVMRRMFRAMGGELARLGVLSEARDVFHLRLDELCGCFDGTSSHRELRALVAHRKSDLRFYAAMPPLPPRFVTRGPVASAIHHVVANASEDLGIGDLQGTSCSPGEAEDEAMVVTEPFQFDRGILVTYRTDPGWIPVFPSAKALLIERGSPLTHAAIVARELKIPTIVQIPGLTRRIQSGMRVKVDAFTGRITILEATAPSLAIAAE